MGKPLILIGLILVAAGLVLTFAPNALSWFGRLPGDIRIEKQNTLVFIPLTSMLLLSVVFSLVMWLLRR